MNLYHVKITCKLPPVKVEARITHVDSESAVAAVKNKLHETVQDFAKVAISKDQMFEGAEVDSVCYDRSEILDFAWDLIDPPKR